MNELAMFSAVKGNENLDAEIKPFQSLQSECRNAF
jgi:hypothetical protein